MRVTSGLVMAAALSATCSFAGVGSSGGGNAVVCRSANGAIESATLLDIYEAQRPVGNLDIRAPLGDLAADYRHFTAELHRVVDSVRANDDAYIDQYVRNLLNSLFTNTFIFTAPGVTLDPVDDVGRSPALPTGCALRQLAVYNDTTHKITIDSDIWNRLDSLNQSALIAHELIWRPNRNAGETTSENSRKIVASFYATTSLDSISDGVPAGSAKCSTYGVSDGASSFYFYADPANAGSTVLQFTKIMDRDVYAPLAVSLPVEIRSADLQTYRTQNNEFFVYVMSPAANFNGRATITTGLYAGYKIAVQYRYRQPLKLSFIDRDGNVIRSAPAISCY